MTRRRPSWILGATAAFGALVVIACGEDGKSLPDDGRCPEQPLYHYVDAGPGADASDWNARMRHPNGDKFTASELADAKKAFDTAVSNGCITAYGFAKSLDAGK